MPRRSSRTASDAPVRGTVRTTRSTPETPRPAKKRRQEETSLNKDTTPRSTAKKSRYFNAQGCSGDNLSDIDSSPESADGKSVATSYVPDTSEEDEQESTSDLDEDEEIGNYTPKRGRRSRISHRASKRTPKGNTKASTMTKPSERKELWREGIRTGLGPGKEVFIELPQARDSGNTSYEDGTLHPNTMLFLKDLKANNDREWLKKHDADYRASKKDWESFVETLSEKIMEKDETIPELPVKDLVFRIYRDVRFSNDPTPYKPHFSAAWSRTGRKGPYAAYYVHLEPGKCFVGSGLWMPDAARLALLRQDFDHRSENIKAVLGDPRVRKEIFGGLPNQEKKTVDAFVSQNQEGALKTKPKGYSSDNKNIDLLRLRSFTFSKKLDDQDVLGPEASDKIAGVIEIMVPFVTYLNSVVMPDPDDAGSEDDEGEDVEDHEETD